MNYTSTRLRRTGAGVTVGALVSSALLFAAPAQAADEPAITSVRESQIALNDDVYAGWHQGAKNDGVPGQFKVINQGLELTGRSQVIKGYADNKIADIDNGVKNVDLTKLADSAMTVASGTASLQVPLFFKDGSDAKFATLRTPLGAGGAVGKGQWESSKQIGNIAPNTPVDLSAIATEIGSTYKVIGFGAYSETGTTVVSNLTFNGTKYLFANSAPTVKDAKLTTKLNTALNISLAATDVDGNTLKYDITGATNGKLTGSGAERVFTPSKNFSGDAVVKYTADDSRGGVSTATITIKVKKLTSKVSIYRVHPASNKITTKSKVYVYAAVSVDGKSAPRGSTVYVYAKGKKVGTGKVNSLGKVKMALPNKLPKGKSTLKVTKVGSKTTNGSSASIAVRIKK